MRKVKNNLHMNNPAVMFAAGLESLISDQMYHPSRFDDVEMERELRVANKQKSRGNLFGSLLRQFARF
jgi:hypothetical protein